MKHLRKPQIISAPQRKLEKAEPVREEQGSHSELEAVEQQRAHLHGGSKLRIIQRDIKSSNEGRKSYYQSN
ncbi:hypothetical protein G4B88_029576, partial [Cannabis sativa]